MRPKWVWRLMLAVLGMAALSGATYTVLAAASLTLNASVAPTSVPAGQRVTYTITLDNSGADPAYDLTLIHTLPTGFTYVPGSAELTLNQTVISRPEPSRSGTTLTWSGLRGPEARSASFYGMHTFVQDRCERAYINGQLDRVRELMGPNAYVKQLLYPVTVSTSGPQSCWVDFVNGCYDRDLIPVVRLAGEHGGDYWLKPPANAPGDYTATAQAFARVVNGLPRRPGRLLYVEIWNEPNLDIEWSGQANPVEYAHLLVDAAAALRALGDGRIVILNGGLSPGGNYNNLSFIDAMASVPGAMQAFDVWSTHPYPGNHPPEYNIHDDAAPIYPELTIDSYLLELDRLAAKGRGGVKVLLTETGYALGQNNFWFQGYAPIEEANRADYISRAFRDHWSRWPEVLGVCPYELVDPYSNWAVWDWLYPNGARHQQYDVVRALDKTPPLAPGVLTLRFSATAPNTPGTYASQVQARASNAGQVILANAAPVQVLPPAATATRTATPTRTPSPTAPLVCNEAILNGGFEETRAWEIPDTAYRAAYSTDRAYAGQRSMRVGIVSGEPVFSYSAARQAIQVPAWATTLRITYQYYAVSTAPSHGRQYALLLDANKAYVETVMWISSNAGQWQQHTFETSGYAGQTVWLQLGAYNDGVEGLTAMYVDEVSVQVCGPEGVATLTPTLAPSATATSQPSHTPAPTSTWTPGPSATPPPPTATATATPTGIPSECQELVANGEFEQNAAWSFPQTAYPGRYSTERARSGARSALLGIVEAGANVYSYSAADQTLTLPPGRALTLSFWHYPLAGGTPGDRQYALLLDAQGSFTTLMWELSETRTWLQRTVDLSAYAGQQVTLRLGVFNDGAGSVAAMYVDDVSLLACDKFAPTPTPAPTATPSATATATSLPTVPPAPTLTPMPAEPVYVEHTLTVGLEPRGVAVDPRTGLVYVANHASADVSVVDADRGQIVATIPLTGAVGCHGIALDGARRRGYVANSLSHSLSVLDLETRAQIGLVPLSAAPQDVAVDAQDGRVYISLPGAGGVAVIAPDTLTQALTLTVGTTPSGLLVDSAGQRLIVAHRHPLFNSLGLYTLPDGEPLATWPVGAEPNAVARDPRTGALFSADMGGRSVTVLSAEGERQRILGLPEAVWQVAYSQRSGRLLALCPASQSLHVLVPDTGATLLSQPVGQGSGAGLAVDQASGRIYVTNSADDTLTILRDQGGAVGSWLPMVLKGLPTAPQAQTNTALIEPGLAMSQQQPGIRALPLLLPSGTSQHRTLAVDGTRRRLAASVKDQVSLMEATMGRPLAEWRLPGQVTAMVFSQETGRLYAALAEQGELYVLAPGQAPRLLAAGLGRPTSLAWGDGRLYLTDLTGRRVVVVAQDGGIMAVSQEAVTPHGLVLDAARQRLYVGDVSAGAILALDAITLQPLGRVVLGGLGLPNGLALSADGERLYASHALSPKYGALTSLDPLTMEHRTTLWGHPSLPLWGASAVAIGSDGEVLLSTAHAVLRLDGASLALRGPSEVGLSTVGGSLASVAQGETVYGLSATGRLWRWQAPDDGKTGSP